MVSGKPGKENTIKIDAIWEVLDTRFVSNYASKTKEHSSRKRHSILTRLVYTSLDFLDFKMRLVHTRLSILITGLDFTSTSCKDSIPSTFQNEACFTREELLHTKQTSLKTTFGRHWSDSASMRSRRVKVSHWKVACKEKKAKNNGVAYVRVVYSCDNI